MADCYGHAKAEVSNKMVTGLTIEARKESKERYLKEFRDATHASAREDMLQELRQNELNELKTKARAEVLKN
ncbi:hypothetical protein IMSHALPRED_008073 [Imshaugia aleurites]|uniref:Uncharacterized protein n=1 Tax=Imshaugia aleurites TaxID=172621 RepID=A0A8H3IWR2_9LECA|nr:hypothetical protein IMSHALPRED_008073 [Imshaugia aleurites]